MSKVTRYYCDFCNKDITEHRGDAFGISADMKEYQPTKYWLTFATSEGGWGNRKELINLHTEDVCMVCSNILRHKIDEFSDFIVNLRSNDG